MPIINRMKYVFQWNQIDEDFRIYKIVSTKNDKESAMQRRKAADMLMNAGLSIRSAVYSGKKQNGAYGTYILVDRAESKDADIRNRFHELCGEMNVKLLAINHAISLKEDHEHRNSQDNDHGDENGLANLLLYGLANEFGYSNVNGSLYYTTNSWVFKKSGEPRRFIKMIRLRFMANGILSANVETWAIVDDKDKTDGPTYSMVSVDQFCRFKTMTPNVTEKTIVRYTQKGLHGHKADIPYLGFFNASAFTESVCGAIQQAIQVVKENGKYMKLVPIRYQDCETLPKGSGIARYSAYSKTKNNGYDQAWIDFLSGTSLCICAGAKLTEAEKEAVKSSVEKLAETLCMDGAVSVEINLDKAFTNAAEENPDRYFIPIIHDKILQNEWRTIGKKLTDSGIRVDEALFKIIQPLYDDHYEIMKRNADIWEKVKYRTQHVSLQSLTEEATSQQIKAEARRIRCEFLIKNDIEKGMLRVFNWEKMDEKSPVTCVQRDKIRIDAKQAWKEEYDRNVYTVMKIFPDGRFRCRSFMETTDSEEEDREIISTDQRYAEKDKQIVTAFRREEKKILSAYDYLQSKDISQLYIYRETPDDGFLIADSPVKMLPDLQKLSDKLLDYGQLTEKQRDDMVQEHLMAAWIANHSSIMPDQLRKRFEEKGKHLSLSMEDMFAISETNDIPEIKWHLAKKGAPTKYVPQKTDDEEKIKKEQAIIDQMLEPYRFTYASAMNVCDNIQYYRDHKDEQDENDRMCLQLFGIRYLKNNRNSKTGALARLNTQCGDMLFTKWKSDASYGIADMGKNFYRLTSKETEPFLQDTGISMYYCGRYDIGNGSIPSGRIWRYVIPADGKPLTRAEMEKLMQTMDTDLITSDNSRTVVPFMAKYMREYADNVIRRYRYETAQSKYADIPSEVQQKICDFVQHSYLS